MVNVQELLNKISSQEDRTIRISLLQELLENATESNNYFTMENFLFLPIEMSEEEIQYLINYDLITENSFAFANVPEDVIDDCPALLVMYEVIEDNCIPVISMYIPSTNVPEEYKELFGVTLINMYRERNFTTDSTYGDENIEIE